MVAMIGATMGFSENLRRAREAKGWTQSEAADHAAVPFRSYQNWEAGIREPRLDALVRLAAAFGLSADELLSGVGDSGPSPEADRPSGKRK
jgi:transcriptional regulator with XRE-family HTH domain